MTHFRRYAVPIWLLVLLILSFGPLIPWLGFYWDDWPVILTGHLQGAEGFWQFYQYDRPISAWTYAVTYPLLGSNPLHWHIFSLLLRWGTSVALWWTLTRLWPSHRREAGWTAALFSVYPVFIQQSISVAYSQHWTCYLLFLFSLGAMVEAWRAHQDSAHSNGRRRFWLFTLAALAASLLQLLTMEYFAGLELLRPLLLWFLVSAVNTSRREKLPLVLRSWLPYLAILIGFATWRMFFLKFPGADANSPGLLLRLITEPASAGLRLLQIAAQDTIHLFISVWANILSPANLDLSDRFSLFSWGWTAVVAAAAMLVLRLGSGKKTDAEIGSSNWSHQALAAGCAAVLLGMLPVWFTDRQIIVGLYSNRFGLPAMLGASLVMVGLLEALISKKVQRIVLLSLLIGLAAGAHLRVANEYRWSWVKQTRFYWNLAWRAPGLLPNTAITPDGEIFPYVGIYSTAAAINLLYPQDIADNQLPYWFYSLGREYGYIIDSFQQGMPLETNFRHYSFKGNSKDVLVVHYEPVEHDCLEVLSPEDANAPGISELTSTAAGNSNLSRILSEPASGPTPLDIFGAEPNHGWCYFYEKAALARQMEDWTEISRLGDQARQAGYAPNVSASDTAFEWLPFIEGYAKTGQAQEAKELSLAVLNEDKLISKRMCDVWEEIALSAPEAAQASSEARQEIGCMGQ